VQDNRERVRVRGVITYYQPGAVVVLQNGAQSLWISTHMREPLRIGDIADASGFPDVRSGFLALTRSEVRDTGVWAPVAPIAANWNLLATSAHIFDLVSYQGTILAEVRAGLQDEYVLAADGKLITAVYRHPDESSDLPTPPMRMLPLGATIRAIGICVPENSNPFDLDKGLNIYLRDLNDMTILANPPWLNMRRLGLIAGVLMGIAILAGLRSWFLERKLRQQTMALARRIQADASLEHRRSLILEDINGNRPLSEILLAIVQMVSFMLNDAPCWCQVGHEPPIGQTPEDLSTLHVCQEAIVGRNGAQIGTLFAAVDPTRNHDDDEKEALQASASLAALAIETRRVYSDLRHRSEFDQLTDAHNRFSFERHMDALVANARENGACFGLIFIDLDRFKEVNDRYGHHIGDLFLQAITQRMRHQLRTHDLLARLGGDEFGVLVPEANTRQDVEEIAHRMQHCFTDPFHFEAIQIRATASIGIALFPYDGATKDQLLTSADTAMYAAKNAQRETLET
jgi:diguanylate cyclase (GGDEF)-like protein